MVDTCIMDGGKAVSCFAWNYKEFDNHSLHSYQETRLSVTDVNDIPGRHLDNTLTFCIHLTAMRAFATGTTRVDIERCTKFPWPPPH